MSINISLMIILFSTVCAWGQGEASKKSVLELSLKADMSCMDLRVIGICPKLNRKPPVGIKVRYWHPEVFMETVKAPGESVTLEYSALMDPLAKKTAQMLLTSWTKMDELVISSGSSSGGLDSANLQFNEAHVFDFPWGALFKTALCSSGVNNSLGVRYLSEMDAVAWRDHTFESRLPQSIAASRLGGSCHDLPLGGYAQCMKAWGPLYPRTGFMVSPIETLGSLVASLRSVSIASDPKALHLVTSQLHIHPDLTKDRVQMVYPIKSACFPIGKDPVDWTTPQQSKDGKYVWIYWHQRECCL